MAQLALVWTEYLICMIGFFRPLSQSIFNARNMLRCSSHNKEGGTSDSPKYSIRMKLQFDAGG